jgi:hypothetical protein
MTTERQAITLPFDGQSASDDNRFADGQVLAT